jgi:hypothetical protein
MKKKSSDISQGRIIGDIGNRKKFTPVVRNHRQGSTQSQIIFGSIVALLFILIAFGCHTKVFGQGTIVKKVWMLASDYGVAGDSSNVTTKWTAFLAKCKPGSIIVLDTSKTYRIHDSWQWPDSVEVWFRASKIVTECHNTTQVLCGNGVTLKNGTMVSVALEAYGSAHGGIGTALSIGSYMLGTGKTGIICDNMTFKAGRGGGNVVLITGLSSNIEFRNPHIIPCLGSDSSNGGIVIHWGQATAPTAGTTHPHNIRIVNPVIDSMQTDSGTAISLSGVYGVTIEGGIAYQTGTAISVFAGDYGYRYADTGTYDSTEFTGGAISVHNFVSLSDSIGVRTVGKSSNRKYQVPLEIDNCYFYSKAGGSGNGFYLLDYTKNVNVSNSKTVGHLNGVSTGAYVSDVTFSFCEFKYASLYGASVSYLTNMPNNILFDHCWFFGNTNGIYASKTARLTVNGCVFDSSYYGVNVTAADPGIDLNLSNNYVRTAKNNANSSFLRLDTSTVMVKPNLFLNNRTYTSTIELVCVASDVPLDSLVTVTGKFRLDSLLVRGSNRNMVYPLTDGTSGQMVTTDGAGNLTFTTPPGATSGDDIKIDTGDGSIKIVDVVAPVLREGANVEINTDGHDTVTISADVSGSYLATAGGTMSGDISLSSTAVNIGSPGNYLDTLYFNYLAGATLSRLNVLYISSPVDITLLNDMNVNSKDVTGIDSVYGRIGVLSQSLHTPAVVMGGDSVVDFVATANANGLKTTNGILYVNFGGTGTAYTVSRTDHTQDATTITSGTISTDRYSAFADLKSAGEGYRLADTATYISPRDHNTAHTQLHDQYHTMTSTASHTAGNYKVFYSDGSGFVKEMNMGNSGYYFKANGLSAAPSWAVLPSSIWGQTVAGDTTHLLSGQGDTLYMLYPDTSGALDTPESLYIQTQSDITPVYGRPGGIHYIKCDTIIYGKGTGTSNIVTWFVSTIATGGVRYDPTSQKMQFTDNGTSWSDIKKAWDTLTLVLDDTLDWKKAKDSVADWDNGGLDSTNVADGKIAEADLLIDGAPTDEYALTWEASSGTGGQMKWEAQTGGTGLLYTTETDSGAWSKFSPASPNTGIIINGGSVIIGDPGLTTMDSLHIFGWMYFDPTTPFDSATWDSMVDLVGRYAGSGSLNDTVLGVNEANLLYPTLTNFGKLTDDSTNWNTAYGWGNWATPLGKLTDDSTNWNTAYGWGNHASGGYASATNLGKVTDDTTALILAKDSVVSWYDTIPGVAKGLDTNYTAFKTYVTNHASGSGVALWDTTGRDTLFYLGSGSDTLLKIVDSGVYTTIQPGVNTGLIIGKAGITEMDSLHLYGRLWLDNPFNNAGLKFDSATYDSMVNLTGRYAGGGALNDSVLGINEANIIIEDSLDNYYNSSTVNAAIEDSLDTYALLAAPTFTGQITADSIDAAELKCDSFRIGSAQYLPADFTNWNSAYGWGDWSTTVGKITDDTTTWNAAPTKANIHDSLIADTSVFLASLTRLGKLTDDSTALIAAKDSVAVWDNLGYPIATVALKGIASFATGDFAVSAGGEVTIKADGIDAAQINGETGTGSPVFSASPTFTGKAAFDSLTAKKTAIDTLRVTTPNSGRIYGTQHFIINIASPALAYAVDPNICIIPATEAALSIVSYKITLNAAPTTETNYKLKWADAFIGKANAAVIDDDITVAGAISIAAAAMDDPTIASGKCIYLLFDAQPDVATTQMCIDIVYTFD